jgi:hypothetical protein
MAYAALVQVEVDPGSDVAHRHSILSEFIVPQLRELPGFASARWLNDGNGVGTCVVQFESREQAERSLEVITPRNGPRVLKAAICEVELEA